MKKNTWIIALIAVLIIGLIIGFGLGRKSAAPEVPAQETATAEEELVEFPTEEPIEAEPEEVPEEPVEPSTEASQEASNEPEELEPIIDEDGQYDSKDEVALYIHTYGHLPSNYVTKSKAKKAGWNGGSLEDYFPGCSIGGGQFGNREGLLPEAKGRTYYECDIDTAGKNSRGAKRIVFSNDGLIFYTDDHYESFTLLYGEDQL